MDLMGVEAGRVGGVVTVDSKRIPIVLVETVLRTDPQEPLTVVQDRIHAALGEAVFET